MTLALVLLLQTLSVDPGVASAPAPDAESRFETCASLAVSDPDKAVEQANQWRIAGGGVPARHCLALAYARQERWSPAAVAFEQAARDSEAAKDGRAANLWVQSGNARLAAREFAPARNAFDAAIASGALTGERLGEAYLDRARARVSLDDAPGGRADLDSAIALAPADPLAWLLSATLARRAGDLARAQKDIAEAARLSPDDASVALEAGNIAVLGGSPEAARAAWRGAIANQPESEAAKAAAAALKALDGETPPRE